MTPLQIVLLWKPLPWRGMADITIMGDIAQNRRFVCAEIVHHLVK